MKEAGKQFVAESTHIILHVFITACAGASFLATGCTPLIIVLIMRSPHKSHSTRTATNQLGFKHAHPEKRFDAKLLINKCT